MNEMIERIALAMFDCGERGICVRIGMPAARVMARAALVAMPIDEIARLLNAWDNHRAGDEGKTAATFPDVAALLAAIR